MGQLLPNPLGLHDVHGNLHEWCASPWEFKLDGSESKGADTPGSVRGICGSSWIDANPRFCGAKGTSPPSRRDFTFGLRLAREFSETRDVRETGDIILAKNDEAPKTRHASSETHYTDVPVYAIDVLHDTIEAEGRYAVGFQASRSTWNDILEGKVLYQADPLRRQVLTASIVFSQMQKNIATRDSNNRLLRVTARNTELLEADTELWPGVKKQIAVFLAANNGWEALVPARPVSFYDHDRPSYEMLAWFQVHPASGRMVGILPDGTHGGSTAMLGEAWNKLKDELDNRLKDAPGGKLLARNPVGGYFTQLSGMYVGVAGVIDGIAEAMSDPSLAALDTEDMTRFLATHALDNAQKYLEEHAHMYDSPEAQFGFWQGAIILPLALGGRDALEKAVQNAIENASGEPLEDEQKEWLNDLLTSD